MQCGGKTNLLNALRSCGKVLHGTQAAQALVVRSYFFFIFMRTSRDIVTAVVYCYTTTEFHYKALRYVVFIAKISKFRLKFLLTFFPIQTFVNSNCCNITPPNAKRPESRGRYVTVYDGGNYVTERSHKDKKIITPHNKSLGGLCTESN